jgi:hypothetical protein
MTLANKWMTAAIVFGADTIVADSAKAEKKYGPGITDTEIKVGQTMPYGTCSSAPIFGSLQKDPEAHLV